MAEQDGRVIAICGAAGGIGSAVARRFASLGNRLSLFDRSADGLAHAVRQAGQDESRALIATGDISRRAKIVDWV